MGLYLKDDAIPSLASKGLRSLSDLKEIINIANDCHPVDHNVINVCMCHKKVDCVIFYADDKHELQSITSIYGQKSGINLPDCLAQNL